MAGERDEGPCAANALRVQERHIRCVAQHDLVFRKARRQLLRPVAIRLDDPNRLDLLCQTGGDRLTGPPSAGDDHLANALGMTGEASFELVDDVARRQHQGIVARLGLIVSGRDQQALPRDKGEHQTALGQRQISETLGTEDGARLHVGAADLERASSHVLDLERVVAEH